MAEMANFNKVVKGLECCDDTSRDTLNCEECPYREADTCSAIKRLHDDALALLREHDAIEPREQEETRTWIVCGNCSQHLISKWLWCPYCGRKVKWK